LREDLEPAEDRQAAERRPLLGRVVVEESDDVEVRLDELDRADDAERLGIGRGEEDDLHARAPVGPKSGQPRSRSDIVRSATGGHSIPNAGSFHRTPRALSGWWN